MPDINVSSTLAVLLRRNTASAQNTPDISVLSAYIAYILIGIMV
jgi:hypothetical protein